jgi:hypothetical protein
MKIRVIKHEAVPDCGSYEVRFPTRSRQERRLASQRSAQRRRTIDLPNPLKNVN